VYRHDEYFPVLKSLGFPAGCVSTFDFAVATTAAAGNVSYWARVQVHRPYAIFWQEKDRSILSPIPPEIPTCTFGTANPSIPSWMPSWTGTPEVDCYSAPQSNASPNTWIKIICLGTILPVFIGGLLLAFLMNWFVKIRRKKGPTQIVLPNGRTDVSLIELRRQKEVDPLAARIAADLRNAGQGDMTTQSILRAADGPRERPADAPTMDRYA
jgi:hypothetical protein